MDTLIARFDIALILIIVISLLLIVKQQMSVEVVLIWLRSKSEK